MGIKEKFFAWPVCQTRSEAQPPHRARMNDGEDSYAGRRFFVENDVSAVFVATYAGRDRIRWSTRSRLRRKEIEYMLDALDVG